jgi:hypothetical protein
MGAWREELDRLLSVNAVKPQRERLTLIRVYEELRGLGYDGSYSSVWRHAQNWEADRGSAAAEAYIPLSFAPGEAYQFDWSHEIVLLGGVTVTVKVSHMRLCHSRMFFVRAYPAVMEGDRQAKARYLLKIEARGELDLAEHVQALLRSTMWKG